MKNILRKLFFIKKSIFTRFFKKNILALIVISVLF